MTQAIELAKAHGIAYYLTPEKTTEMHGTDRQIEAFAEAIRAEEREACAKVCEEFQSRHNHSDNHGTYLAFMIRERSNAALTGDGQKR